MKSDLKLFWAGIAVLAFALFQIYLNWDDIRGIYFSDPASFSVIEGKIVSSSTYKSNPRRGGPNYYYEIEYEFIVNEKRYHSNRITFYENGSTNPGFAQSYVNKYPVGKQVNVYYDTNDPSFSVLEPEEKGGAEFELALLIISFVMLAKSGVDIVIRKKFSRPTE
jgi:Protein of unknown function (DUF3592)